MKERWCFSLNRITISVRNQKPLDYGEGRIKAAWKIEKERHNCLDLTFTFILFAQAQDLRLNGHVFLLDFHFL